MTSTTAQKDIAKVNFTKVGNKDYECDLCHKHITSNDIDRRISHLRNCPDAPAAIKSQLSKRSVESMVIISNPSQDLSVTSNTSTPNTSTYNEDSRPFKRIEQWMDQMSTSTKDQMDIAFAKIFFDTAIPFRIADSHAFKQFLQLARPVYKPPTSKQIAGLLLDKAYFELTTVMEQIIEETPFISLVSDGWSNICNKHLVNFVAVSPGKAPMFLTSISTRQSVQTGAEVALCIEEMIMKIGLDKVCAVVTDNAANMRNAWEIIEQKYPSIFCNGFAAHVFNLLIKDVCEHGNYTVLLSKARSITSFIRQWTAVLDQFHVSQKFFQDNGELEFACGLVYPNNTRWYSQHTCIVRLLSNDLVIKSLAVHTVVSSITGSSCQKREEFHQIVADDCFWSQLDTLQRILEPASTFIGILESNLVLLSDVYRCFPQILTTWEGNFNKLNAYAMRQWTFIHTESMGFAYFLDPKTAAGSNMYGNDQEETLIQLRLFISNHFTMLMPEFAPSHDQNSSNDILQMMSIEINQFIDYIVDGSPTAQANIQSSSTMAWWKTIGKDKLPLLFTVAKRVFVVPTSSAASERIWITYDFIHSKRRNKLSEEKTTKLVALYANSAIEASARKEMDYAKLMMNYGDSDSSNDDA